MAVEMVEKFRTEAEKRVNELREEVTPLQTELAELEAALSKLRGESPAEQGAASTSNDNGAPQAEAPAQPRRRRRRQGGTRGDEFVKLVEENPGRGVSDIAKEMKIKPNYLYRIAADLVKEGRVKKDGRGYQPA